MASELSPGSHNPFRRKANNTSSGSRPAPAPEAVLSPPPPLPSTPTDAEPSIFHSELSQKPQAPKHSAGDFAKALESLGKSDAPPPPSTTFQKQKPVKKVRVQSPPPSSPESASADRSYPKYPLPERDDDDESSVSSVSVDGEREDPFQNEAPPIPEDALASMAKLDLAQPQPQPQPYTGRGPPPNPFGRTLEDMELAAKDGGQSSAEQSASAGKAGLDVEAFKRLLLTGQGPAPGASGTGSATSSSHPTGLAGDGGSMTDASSVSRQSLFDANHLQESPRTSHEISEPEGDEHKHGQMSTPQPKPSARKKPPPPPPATRHGKLIKVELKDKNKDKPAAALERRISGGLTGASPMSPGRRSSVSPAGVNKPLPPPPARSEDDPKESIFDKESAGKVPELDIDPEADVIPSPRPPTPPNTSHTPSTPLENPASTPRKPAPPPRRQSHARTESSKSQPDTYEETGTPPRSSLDSNISRSSSIRVNTAVPTPPPPRRPAGHRNSPSLSGTIPNNALSPAFPFPVVSASPTITTPGFPQGTLQHPAATDTSSGATAASNSPNNPAGAKPSPPPRPPQRNASTRKGAASSSSLPNRPGSSHEVPARKQGVVPPPPPPRLRGSSRGSMDGPGKASGEAVAGGAPEKVASVAEGAVTGGVAGVDVGASDEAVRAMLADLDALQREVEAARAAAAGGG
ncbi:hypothetical protein VM1G_07580 [Cytospora mali]|uniref:Uncharacterized protein n=1 Tax=Cytospora mali TaxID=578113 RepID=A0A194W8D8_CYTMA|nr:hypothetical protein VM1G_07580 [Valsa mali]